MQKELADECIKDIAVIKTPFDDQIQKDIEKNFLKKTNLSYLLGI